MPNEILSLSRRRFLKTGTGVFIAGVMGVFVKPISVLAGSTDQSDWRFCNKCQAIFYNGYRSKGRCPTGGAHAAQGYNFVLPHDVRGTPTTQSDWRFCNKCQAMFYDGYPNKGRCAAGGVHVAQGYNFVLPHPPYSSAHCNDGSCQSGYGTPAELCRNHKGDDPTIGCTQEQ
jgi:hypothetical protein